MLALLITAGIYIFILSAPNKNINDDFKILEVDYSSLPLLNLTNDIYFQDLRFKINLDKEYDFCGYVPIIMCGVGEPAKYYAIDSTLTKELYIIIETSKRDQKRYDIYFPETRDSIFNTIPELSITDYKKYLNGIGILESTILKKTKCKLNDRKFYGHGYTNMRKNGSIYSTYEIYGYINDVLVGVKSIVQGPESKLEIDQLYSLIKTIDIQN